MFGLDGALWHWSVAFLQLEHCMLHVHLQPKSSGPCATPTRQMVRIAAPTMMGDLDGVLGQYVAKAKEQGQQPFALGQYATLPMTAAPQCKGLVALAEVLRVLLVVSPAAIINFKELERALGKLDEQYSLKPGALSRGQWASVTACQLRVALAHLRKLKQLPKLWQQRSRELTDHGRQVLEDLIDQYTPTLGTVSVETSPASGALGKKPLGTGPEEEPSSPPKKRAIGLEVGSPDFRELAGTEGSEQHSSSASASEANGTGKTPGQLSGTGAASNTGQTPRQLSGTEVAALLQALASQPVKPTERAQLGPQLAALGKAKWDRGQEKRQEKFKNSKKKTGQKTKEETKKQTKKETNRKIKKESKKEAKKETKQENKQQTNLLDGPNVDIKQAPLLPTTGSPEPALRRPTEPSVWEGGLAKFAPLSVHTANAGQGRTYIQAKVMGHKILVCEISGTRAGDKHRTLALELRNHIQEKDWTKEQALAWRKDVVGY